jgi:hypothetical protein
MSSKVASELTSQKLGLLKKSVNRALFCLYAPVDNVRVEIGSSGNDLVRTLTAVDNKAANMWLLAAAGRKYASTLKLKDNRAFDSLVLACGYLRQTVEAIGGHLFDLDRAELRQDPGIENILCALHNGR